ncbi:MAG: ATP-binding protein, partial [Deltaproteobacteria bacterium]|nr:ATP-binding protein [Deltaproteobacteria bacterium]
AARPARPRSRRGSKDAGSQATLQAELPALDPTLWSQRLALDRARLSFYELDPARRAALLHQHALRQEAVRQRETEAERRAREAEAERAHALEAARAARTEAERIVSEELARLITLETRVGGLRDELKHARDDLAGRRDAVLGWQRRVRDAKATGAAASDAIYDTLRRALHDARDQLSAAIGALSQDDDSLPQVGPDALANVPADIPTEAVRERRAALERAIAQTRQDEHVLREDRAAELLEEITQLNVERLGLLPHLSSAKRDAITGFTAVGWDQARSEVRHLALVLRYHQHIAAAWVQSVRGGKSGGVSAFRTITLVLPLLLAVAAFAWGRRKTQALLRWGEARLAAAGRAERRITPGLGLRAMRILLKTHRPLEWILFFLGVASLLPEEARSLLEVQLIASVLSWTLAGALVVNAVNAIAAGGAGAVLALEDDDAGRLRLRSLRFVGRTVIGFALVLVLSARLVGEGTIYSWVLSSCGLAALLVFLVLVRWWRGTVFDRLDRLRKKTPLQAWILANRTGWKSAAAAMTGAVQLFTMGALKLARGWLSSFDLARRVHAYLFKREIERIGGGQAHAVLAPLGVEALGKLDPELAGRWLDCPAEELREALVRRARERRGGLIAVVAPRGMGKSSLLRAIVAGSPGAQVLECRADTGTSALRDALKTSPPIVLLDDAHALVEARIGGLVRFDEAIAFAREHSAGTTWVFAFDASVWPLLKRARDARPLFDEQHLLAAWD